VSDNPVVEGLKASADAAKQVIALASGIVALTITFAKEFKPPEAKLLTVPCQMKLAWILYGATVFFGVWTLLAISGSLSDPAHPSAKLGPMGSNVRIPSFLMLLCFVAALGLTIAAGFSIVH
jgi:hypothetical protein